MHRGPKQMASTNRNEQALKGRENEEEDEDNPVNDNPKNRKRKKRKLDNAICIVFTGVVVILLVAVGIFEKVNASNNQVKNFTRIGNYFEKKMKDFPNWENRHDPCKLYRLKSPTLVEEKSALKMYKELNSFGISSFWLPLFIKKLKHPEHLDGQTWTDGQTEEANYCYLLLTNAKEQYRETECSDLWSAALCQKHRTDVGSWHCYESKVGTRLFQVGDSCFRVVFDKMNWFEARFHCEVLGMTLAVVKSPSQAREIKARIDEYYSIHKQQAFWIGLRQADIYPLEGDNPFTGQVFWNYNQPDLRKQCSVAIRNDKGYYWETKNCSATHSLICTASGASNKGRPTTETIGLMQYIFSIMSYTVFLSII